jgi:hypothetical protein
VAAEQLLVLVAVLPPMLQPHRQLRCRPRQRPARRRTGAPCRPQTRPAPGPVAAAGAAAAAACCCLGLLVQTASCRCPWWCC